MANISRDLQRIIDDFSNLPGITPEMADNLLNSIERSPVLVEQMNTAVEQKYLKAFVSLEGGSSVGARYDGVNKCIQLPLASLSPIAQSRQRTKNDMTFVLGHEIQHGFNHAERQRTHDNTIGEMNAIAKSKDPLNVYDNPVYQQILASRADEAKAHIAGWNAALSQLENSRDQVTLDDMRDAFADRAKDFLEENKETGRFQAKPGLVFNADNSLSFTSSNVEIMARYYYDNSENKIGPTKSTYREHDGAIALGHAVEAHRRHARPHRGQEPEFLVDMEGLGLQEDRLEINGINLGKDGARHPRQPYFDTSQGQVRPGFLDHTTQSHVHVPIAASNTFSQGRVRSPFSDPGHADHALYIELKQRLPPETSADRLAEITLAAKLGDVRAGQIQSVAIKDDTVFIVGKTPGERAKVELSAPPPAEQETMHRLETFDRHQAQLQQYRTEQMQVNSEGRVGPRMTF